MSTAPSAQPMPGPIPQEVSDLMHDACLFVCWSKELHRRVTNNNIGVVEGIEEWQRMTYGVYPSRVRQVLNRTCHSLARDGAAKCSDPILRMYWKEVAASLQRCICWERKIEDALLIHTCHEDLQDSEKAVSDILNSYAGMPQNDVERSRKAVEGRVNDTADMAQGQEEKNAKAQQPVGSDRNGQGRRFGAVVRNLKNSLQESLGGQKQKSNISATAQDRQH